METAISGLLPHELACTHASRLWPSGEICRTQHGDSKNLADADHGVQLHSAKGRVKYRASVLEIASMALERRLLFVSFQIAEEPSKRGAPCTVYAFKRVSST